MFKYRAIIMRVACATWVVLLGAGALAQTGQQQPTAGNRPPDPAAVRQGPATTFKAPDDIDYRDHRFGH